MYLDGASRSPTGEQQEDIQNNKARIGVVFVTPNNTILHMLCHRKDVAPTVQQGKK